MADKKKRTGEDENKDPFNLPTKTKLFFGKADTDTSREILGVEERHSYIDALNVRVNDTTDGSDKAAKSIGGEQIYSEELGLTGYRCIGSTNVGSKQVEFWAAYNPASGGIIRIDGIIMCRSADFNISPDWLLQWDTNNDVIGGEIYITDFRIKPMYFSIKDIIDNFGVTQKYFADFNINNFIITLLLPTDNIIYDTSPLVNVGTGGGLPTGQYSYSHRFASDAGDRTNWSVPTPLIFVPFTYQNPNPLEPFAGLKTLGNDPDPDTPGAFGVKLLFRVNNLNNYEFVEIRRTPYNGGEAIDYSPPSYIVKRLALPLDQTVVQIFEYIDSTANQSDELVLAEEDTQNVLSAIKRARAIRYFFNKVILGNIEYESRDITNAVTFLESVNGNTMCPIMENITSEGYKNPHTHAYRKMYMHDEAYGFYLICWDSNFSRSLGAEIPGFSAYTMPSKRNGLSQILGGDPVTYSKFWSRQASVRGIVENTFEVVDYKLGDTRQLGGESGAYQTLGRNILTGHAGSTIQQKDSFSAATVGYRPFFPQAPYDMRSTYRYTPMESTSTIGLAFLSGQPQSAEIAYDPYIFNPQYNALGMCLVGVDQVPDWATAFSVVRTKKAGRVVAQGMAFWNMIDATIWNPGGGGGEKGTGKKSRNKIAVQFPDIENGVIGSATVNDIISNPSSFRLQMVEPLGFNSEIFHFRSCSLNNPSRPGGGGLVTRLHADTQVDMVVYPACQAELAAGSSYGTRRVVGTNEVDNPASETGIQDLAEPANTTGYVAFGLWRNQPNGSPTIGGLPFFQNGDYKFTILSAQIVTQEENISHIVLELGDENGIPIDIYIEEGGNLDDGDFYSNQVKNFTEPIYVVNLLRDGATVANLDFQSLLSTGNFVKIRSVIGYSTGFAGQTMVLCGERIEDVYKLSAATIDKYVWVEMDSNGNFFRWINTAFLNAGQLAIIAADILNGTTIYNGERLYGTYRSTVATEYAVVFDNPLYIPPAGGRVEVRYDNRNPVYVFGGDTVVGYANFPVVHRSTNTSDGTGDQPGDGNNYGNMLKWNRFMPFLWWRLRRNYYIVKNSAPPLIPVIQAYDAGRALTAGTDWCKGSAIRQMVVMYNCQSYSHLPLSYHSHYPVVNYVMRPTKWDEDHKDRNIDKQYFTDYPGESDRWRLGGIKIAQFTPAIINLDYSKENITDRYSKVASFLFVENTWFPTRIIWSYTRPIQNILAPNLKSFAPFNIFDISDNRGQIQRLYSFKHGGENIYAGCEDDWCTVLTRKRTLTDLTGDSLGVTGNGQDTAFIQEQIWMNEIKKGALKGEFWKTFAENGDEAFYANYNGVFKFAKSSYGSEIIDITEGYFYQLWRSLCSRVERPDTNFLQQELYGIYNTKDDEYWIRFKTQIGEADMALSPSVVSMADSLYGMRLPHFSINKTIAGTSVNLIPYPSTNNIITVLYKVTDTTGEGVPFFGNGNPLFTAQDGDWWEVTYNLYSLTTEFTFKEVDKELNDQRDTFLFAYSNRGESSRWLGIFDYDFETFNSFDNKIYGQRDDGTIKTYALGEGVIINGEKLNMRIFSTMNPQIQQSYVFERTRMNASDKADIKLYNVDDMSVSVATLVQGLLKNYHAFENYIPRNLVSRDKNSNTHILYQIHKQLADKQFFVNSITFFYNKIK